MRRLTLAALILGLAPGGVSPAADDPGPFVQALWLVHRQGLDTAADPRNDARTKGLLFQALGKDGTLSSDGAKALMGSSAFARIAGADGRLDPAEARLAVAADVPESRRRLSPKVVAHLDQLSTSFDRIDEPHREAGAELAGWIAQRYQPGRPLDVTVICTGNSRRSLLGSTMGNVAAQYYGLPEVRFHSGGTAPTAFNSRTITALREAGIEVEPTGEQAPRGEPSTANPVYRVRWGVAGDPAGEIREFSKKYLDPTNPQADFAALLVCGEADAACPVVKGASIRVAMPYLDPKIFDGSPFEAAKYAERRDDLGRLMLAAMLQARRRVEAR